MPRVLAAPYSPRPAELISMQRTLGNRATGAMLARLPIQAKLLVSAPGDYYEREADRIADAVMRAPAMRQEEPPARPDPPPVMNMPALDQATWFPRAKISRGDCRRPRAGPPVAAFLPGNPEIKLEPTSVQ